MIMSDHSVGGVRLNSWRIMNLNYRITLEIIWLECFHFGLTIKLPSDFAPFPSLFNPGGQTDDKLDVQQLNGQCSAEKN